MIVANTWKSEFAYDGLMRRRVRKEFTWSASAWVLTNEVRYVYDGRLVLQERHYTPNGNTLVPLKTVTYTRGNDLSGTLEEAGGIGGLLARSDSGEGGSPHSYYHADGNGNVTALVTGDGKLVARYSYDPYGNMLAMSGPMAEANLYRFSSKEWHANSGLVYYLYRYYEPGLQRWMNRDPIEEVGGINLLRFGKNGPLKFVDPYGQTDLCLMAEWELAAGEVGWDTSAGFVYDTDSPLDSGIYISGGPAKGAAAGIAVGGFVSQGDIEGESVNFDVDVGAHSATLSAGDCVGCGASVGFGGGMCFSETRTETLGVGDVGYFMERVDENLYDLIMASIIRFNSWLESW